MTAPIDITHPLGGMSTLNNFCKRNQIGRSSAYEQIRDGRLAAVKLGSRTYIKYEDEIAWRNALQGAIRPVGHLRRRHPKPSLAGVF